MPFLKGYVFSGSKQEVTKFNFPSKNDRKYRGVLFPYIPVKKRRRHNVYPTLSKRPWHLENVAKRLPNIVQTSMAFGECGKTSTQHCPNVHDVWTMLGRRCVDVVFSLVFYTIIQKEYLASDKAYEGMEYELFLKFAFSQNISLQKHDVAVSSMVVNVTGS